MDYGAHLPLISFSGETRTLDQLIAFTSTARDLEYKFLCANDHLVFSRPWLDGLAALASVASHSGQMNLATTISLPGVRGPAPLAKSLAAIDILSNGRLIVGLGPGSSPRDYNLVGLNFEERWQRLEESVHTLRAFFAGTEYTGDYYSTAGEQLEPFPVQRPSPPIWLGSWGAKRAMKRTAALADGWLASGYNTNPLEFSRSFDALCEERKALGLEMTGFPSGLATVWTYVTDEKQKADKVLNDILYPMLKRSYEELAAKLPIGSATQCADRLRPYRKAGLNYLFIWPIADEVQQLKVFREEVIPLIESD